MRTSVQVFKDRLNGSESHDCGVIVMAVNTTARADYELNFMVKRFGSNATVKQLQGCWEGKQEVSYAIIPFPGQERVVGDIAREIADEHKQDSILCLSPSNRNNGHRVAWLFWMKQRRSQVVGVWQAVPAAEAVQAQGWTRDGGTFYVVK